MPRRTRKRDSSETLFFATVPVETEASMGRPLKRTATVVPRLDETRLSTNKKKFEIETEVIMHLPRDR